MFCRTTTVSDQVNDPPKVGQVMDLCPGVVVGRLLGEAPALR